MRGTALGFTLGPSSSKARREDGAQARPPFWWGEVFYCGLTRRRTTAKATSPEATSASAAGKASEVPPVSGRGFAEALAVALALAEAAAPPAALSSTKRTCRLSAKTVPTAKAL